jgi:hypothetical protein
MSKVPNAKARKPNFWRNAFGVSVGRPSCFLMPNTIDEMQRAWMIGSRKVQGPMLSPTRVTAKHRETAIKKKTKTICKDEVTRMKFQS